MRFDICSRFLHFKVNLFRLAVLTAKKHLLLYFSIKRLCQV
nr:MAG TPA: hypothetical protein [Caudoviricetes sp.]DAW87766.1 MAG TPA: hypothetical protein [Bacteriophage sp.]